MGITLDHLIVPAADKDLAAAFLAGLLGLEAGAPSGPFTPVRINDDTTLDFDDRHHAQPGHYAFLLDDDAFDALLARLAADLDVEYGSGPWNGWDRRTNDLGGGRGVYVRDPNGHSYEFFTAVP
ncbi:VOC family protein [Nonomuraea sp. NPDC050227]|uniref:VOC family protein n=1 Tax=Nonomuraea sp. NPDC050227 TaxID=3364360 RepID=UPI0037B46A24